jgi:CHAT domain-containing protein/tetratricopeptide (TPR) repeat protein
MKLKRGEISAAYQETDGAFRTYPSAQTEWHWRFRVLKAEILHRQGRDTESLALLKEPLPSSLAISDLAVQRKLAQGVASAFTQRLDDAQRFLAEAEALAKANHPDLLGDVALRKGTVYFFAGDAVSAENAYRNALQFARAVKDPFLEAAALSGLGVAATKQARYDESIDWNKRALDLSQAIGARHSFAQTLGNMGWSYIELGDFENALAFYKQAEESSVRAGLLADRVYWLTSIAYVYSALRDYSSAQAILEQALNLARSQDDKGTLVQCLNQFSELAIETGQINLAERYTQEVLQLSGSGLEQRLVLDAVFFRGRIAESKHDYAAAQKSFEEVIREPNALKSQRWQAQARLAKSYAEDGKDRAAEIYFRRSLASVESVRSTVQAEDLRLSFFSSAIEFYNDYVDFLISRHRPDDALRIAELSRARTLAEGLGTAPKGLTLPVHNFRPQEIARRASAVILFYSLGQKDSYLWAITSAKVVCIALPSQREIDPLVKSYRDAVLSGRDVLETRNAEGARLYKILIEPAKKLIPHGSRVIVLPNESLYSFNFETLLVPEPKPHFWIEDVTVSTASSLTLLSLASRTSPGSSRNLLLVGNARQTAPEFLVLRQAETEMARVQSYFPDSRREVIDGAKATPAAFLASKPEKFAYIHFVTHGTASRTHPLDSAVILSPEGDSFKLYARDIVRHPLSADLVTISACNGSGTRAYSGEGLVGLSWAFLRAGAHNVIAALWEVNDDSTPQLMDKMYSELSRGQDPASALRSAKLSLLKSDSVFKKPFYWAPFQLYSGS